MQGLGKHVVFVDSNVLYSRTTADWLGLLYTESGDAPPFTVCWTEEILADVIHHLRKNHPTWDGAKIARIHDRYAETFEVGRVTDFTVDGTYQGGDPDDAHVHAAALACGADILLTYNTKHFVWEGSEAYYDTMTPDEFFTLVDDAAPALVRSVVCQQREYWIRKTNEADLRAQLGAAACPQFAQRVLRHLHELAGIHIRDGSGATPSRSSEPW